MKKREKKEREPRKPERTATGGLDYSVYYMKPAEKMMYILLAAAVLFALGYIFYHSIIIAAAFMILAVKFPTIQTQTLISRRRRNLTLQFKDMLYSLSSAVGAGNSVERAMTVVLSDLERQYVDQDTYIIQEVSLIVSKLGINQNIEDLFRDFAARSGIEDIRTFANIFEISKRTGGNLMQIIRQTSSVITQKIETANEIETLLAEKKMEQKVMVAMPIALTAILTFTTGEFMAPLFTGIIGRIVCTFALALIVVGYLWSKKLTDIRI